jgi:hypothetical protein
VISHREFFQCNSFDTPADYRSKTMYSKVLLKGRNHLFGQTSAKATVRTLDRLSTLTHGFWLCVEAPLLHGLEQMIVLAPGRRGSLTDPGHRALYCRLGKVDRLRRNRWLVARPRTCRVL